MKLRSIALLLVAELLAMSLWFVSAAILPDMLREASIPPIRQAALSSAVQAGFVVGALASAWLGLADRLDPRHLFAASALLAALANAVLLAVEPGGAIAIGARFATGALLAGVYPVGMKIAVGWGQRNRGLLVGALVGALTLGSAAPHLPALAGGANWRLTVAVASIAAALAALIALRVGLGPHHARAPAFDPRAIAQAWTNRRVRLAYAGYLGHMWELYAMWTWVAVFASASFAVSGLANAGTAGSIAAFLAIGSGAVGCVLAGFVADRAGKARVAMWAMIASAACAVLTIVVFGRAPWLLYALVMVWGFAVVADSAQFSALVSEHAPRDHVGTALTIQTCLGFLLTIVTIEALPRVAGLAGWQWASLLLVPGPVLGASAMHRL